MSKENPGEHHNADRILPIMERDYQARINRLRFALYRFGGHIPPCPGRPCECGFKTEWDAADLPAIFGDVMRIAQLNALVPELPPQSSGEVKS
jgi:hypothetical protein